MSTTEEGIIKLEEGLIKLLEPTIDRIVESRVSERLDARRGDDQDLLSVKHASERFDVPEGTIRKWLQRGQIKRYKVRGCVRVRVSELLTVEE